MTEEMKRRLMFAGTVEELYRVGAQAMPHVSILGVRVSDANSVILYRKAVAVARKLADDAESLLDVLDENSQRPA